MKCRAVTRRLGVTEIVLALAMFVLVCHPSLAVEWSVDVDSLMFDLQKQTSDPDGLAMAFWMPEEFWRLCLEAPGLPIPEAEVEKALEVLRPYLVFAVANGRLGPFGGMNFVDEATLRSTLQLLDRNGRRYSPLEDKDISPDAKNFTVMMKSVIGSTMGQLGGGVHFFYFSAIGRDGNRIAEATKEGKFSIQVGEELFDWKLPMGALLPPKICPVDGEQLNGAWKFCPWHGAELPLAED